MSNRPDGESACTAVGSLFSQHVTASLRAIVGDATDESPVEAVSASRGRWRCPADGAAMAVVGQEAKCVQCERVLPRSLLYEIRELNPHTRVSAARGRPLRPPGYMGRRLWLAFLAIGIFLLFDDDDRARSAGW
jgi:hypothetical protein